MLKLQSWTERKALYLEDLFQLVQKENFFVKRESVLTFLHYKTDCPSLEETYSLLVNWLLHTPNKREQIRVWKDIFLPTLCKCENNHWVRDCPIHLRPLPLSEQLFMFLHNCHYRLIGFLQYRFYYPIRRRWRRHWSRTKHRH